MFCTVLAQLLLLIIKYVAFSDFLNLYTSVNYYLIKLVDNYLNNLVFMMNVINCETTETSCRKR